MRHGAPSLVGGMQDVYYWNNPIVLNFNLGCCAARISFLLHGMASREDSIRNHES